MSDDKQVQQAVLGELKWERCVRTFCLHWTARGLTGR